MTVVSRPGSPRPVTPQSILASRLDRLARRLEAAGRLDEALAGELREVCALAGGLDPYLDRWTTPESADLRRLAQRTEAQDWNAQDWNGQDWNGQDWNGQDWNGQDWNGQDWNGQDWNAAAGDAQDGHGHLEQEMLSGHVEGQLLKMLVYATRARRVLEIGMFTGYSALAMAEALPDDGQLVACEIDAGVAAFAERCFRESACGHKIEVRVGPAQRTLTELAEAGERFDLVFIDADKAGYAGYLTTVLDAGLLLPNALICVDNTLMQGQPWMPGDRTPNGAAVAAFNQAVAADSRVEQVIIPLRDGVTLIRRAHRR